MEQQQFKVSFSLGTKLLVSVVALLLLAIAFLNASTIFLFVEDKRAYIYQAQSIETVLASRDLSSAIQSATDTLRQIMGTIHPSRAASPQERERLKVLIANQSEVIGVQVFRIKEDGSRIMPLANSERHEDLVKTGLSMKESSHLTSSWGNIARTLFKSGIALFNASQLGQSPVLGIALADLEEANQNGVPVAFGYVSLAGFGKEISSSLAVADQSGQVLFSTNPEEFFTKKTIADDPLLQAALKSPVTTGTMEYEHHGEKTFGSFFKPKFNLVVLSRTPWDKAMRSAYALTEKFVLLALMTVGCAIIFAIVFSKRLTAPVNRLYAATRQISAGNFDVELQPKSKDEIGALTDSFTAMARRIRSLIAEQVEKAHLDKEIAIASTVQQTLIPPPEFDSPMVEIKSHYQSASECGGDWWGFFGVGNKLCIMVADATGHGIPSALITASARSCFSVMHKLATEVPEFAFSPGSMLSYANRVVHDAAKGQIMMTFFAGVFDFDTKQVTYSSAGHNPPWLFKKLNDGFKLQSMTVKGTRLGEERDVPPFEEKTLSFDSGDILFLYTDGLTEGKNHQEEMFGKKKVRISVEANLAQGPSAVVENLMNEFLAHNGDKPLDDDVTLAVMRIK